MATAVETNTTNISANAAAIASLQAKINSLDTKNPTRDFHNDLVLSGCQITAGTDTTDALLSLVNDGTLSINTYYTDGFKVEIADITDGITIPAADTHFARWDIVSVNKQGGAIVTTGAAITFQGTSDATNTTTTFTDNLQNFNITLDDSYELVITGGTGSGQRRTITSNTTTVLTITEVFTTVPLDDSTYKVGLLTPAIPLSSVPTANLKLARVHIDAGRNDIDSTDIVDLRVFTKSFAEDIGVEDKANLLTAVNVEAALAEIAGDVSTLTSDATSDASTLFITDTNSYFSGTSIQDALNQLSTDVGALSTTDITAAEQISISNQLGLFETANVQAALDQIGGGRFQKSIRAAEGLDIDGTASITGTLTTSEISSGSTLSLITNSSNDISISPNNTTAITIQSGGNVGIGDTSPSELLVVAGNTNITGDLNVDGTARLGIGTLTVDGQGNVGISGTLSLSGVDITATATEINLIDGYGGTTAQLNFVSGVTAGTSAANKAVVLNGSSVIDAIEVTTLTVPTISGNTIVSGDLSISSDLDVDGTVSFGGNISSLGVLDVRGQSTQGGEVRLFEDSDNGTNYIGLKAPDILGADFTLTLPDSDGTNGEVLITDGSGKLTFGTSAGGGATASADQQIWIQPHATSGTGATLVQDTGNWGTVRFGNDVAAQNAFFSFNVPSNFLAVSKAIFTVFTQGAGGTFDFDILTNFADDTGDQPFTGSGDSMTGTQVLTTNDLKSIDIADAFTPIAAGDHVGLKITRDGGGGTDDLTTVELTGFLLEYTTT